MKTCNMFKKRYNHLLIKGIGQFPNYIKKLICNKCNEWIDSLTLFDMGGGHDGPLKMFLTTVQKRLGGGS